MCVYAHDPTYTFIVVVILLVTLPASVVCISHVIITKFLPSVYYVPGIILSALHALILCRND